MPCADRLFGLPRWGDCWAGAQPAKPRHPHCWRLVLHGEAITAARLLWTVGVWKTGSDKRRAVPTAAARREAIRTGAQSKRRSAGPRSPRPLKIALLLGGTLVEFLQAGNVSFCPLLLLAHVLSTERRAATASKPTSPGDFREHVLPRGKKPGLDPDTKPRSEIMQERRYVYTYVYYKLC